MSMMKKVMVVMTLMKNDSKEERSVDDDANVNDSFHCPGSQRLGG